MTKIPATNFTATGLRFVYSTDDADPFDRDEVNLPAQALDQHTHASTLGLPVMRLGSGVQAAGPMLLADGAAATPSLAFQNAPTTGLFQSSGVLHITTGGTDRWQVNASGHLLAAADNTYDIGASGATRPRNLYLSGNVTADFTGTFGSVLYVAQTDAANAYLQLNANVRLQGEAAHVLAQRYGTNAQTLRVYNTFTNASNYERLSASAGASSTSIIAEALGSGSVRPLTLGTGSGSLGPSSEVRFQVNGAVKWAIDANGTLYPSGGDNSMIIGSAGLRPSQIYVGTRINNADGSVGSPSYTFQNATGSGMWQTGSLVVFSAGGSEAFRFGGAAMLLNSGFSIYPNSGTSSDLGIATNKFRNVFVSGAVANRTKAGTPVDADVNTPTDGMLVVDTTASKIWVRVGGTWKGVAVA